MNQPAPDRYAVRGRRLSRRRLFELGGASAALAALLAACGSDHVEPGRIGVAPLASPLPDEEIDDVAYLRTLASVERSIIAIYGRLQADAGLDGAPAAALERFVADHTAIATALDTLTTDAGGTAYACPNPWYEDRYFEPTLGYLFGDDGAEPPIPASDDVARDALTLVRALESLSQSSYLRFTELVSSKHQRAELAAFSAQAARRSAVTSLLINPGVNGYVSPHLLDENSVIAAPDGLVATAPLEAPTKTAADGESLPPEPPPIPPVYAIANRYTQLVAVSFQVGAPNELNLRFSQTFDTPAENAYIYASQTCEA